MFRAGDMNNGSITHTPEANPQKKCLEQLVFKAFLQSGSQSRARIYTKKL
jgi:hypothetical protein